MEDQNLQQIGIQTHSYKAIQSPNGFYLSKDGKNCFCPKRQPLAFPSQNALNQPVVDYRPLLCETSCPFAELTYSSTADGAIKGVYAVECEHHKKSFQVEVILQKKSEAVVKNIIQ